MANRPTLWLQQLLSPRSCRNHFCFFVSLAYFLRTATKWPVVCDILVSLFRAVIRKVVYRAGESRFCLSAQIFCSLCLIVGTRSAFSIFNLCLCHVAGRVAVYRLGAFLVLCVNWAAKAKLVSRVGLVAFTSVFLSGCEWAVLDPKGPVGMGEKNLILLSVGLMLIVVVPVIVMTLAFAWRYRASNTKATYAPNWSHSNAIEVVVWAVPIVIILILGTVTWISTHTLDPRQPLASNEKPLEVEVVSLDWKWLFIYPEYGVASVNELAMPVGRAVHFKLTSSGVMNAFFIPQLGTQVYTMPGMQSLVNLRADHAGTYDGISANYSGHGFADMHFAAKAMDGVSFKAWIAKAKTAGVLDQQAYITLMTKGTHPVAHYGKVGQGLYYRILNRCAQGGVCTDDAVTMARMKDQSPGIPFCAEPPKPIQSKAKG